MNGFLKKSIWACASETEPQVAAVIFSCRCYGLVWYGAALYTMTYSLNMAPPLRCKKHYIK
jgi:hypothetical protein